VVVVVVVVVVGLKKNRDNEGVLAVAPTSTGKTPGAAETAPAQQLSHLLLADAPQARLLPPPGNRDHHLRPD
jgi:hypothetical protein